MKLNAKLETIQTQEKLNDIYQVGEVGPGGAYHEYCIITHLTNMEENDDFSTANGHIQFQCGPRHVQGSTEGVIDSDLLEIVRDRMKSFQSGEFACEYNEKALYHIEEALKCLNKRVEDRIARNTLGTYNK